MTKYLLETSAIINLLRNKNLGIPDLSNNKLEFYSSYICLAELYEGVFRVKNKEKAEKQIIALFSGLEKIYGVDKKIAVLFGQIRANLKARGRIIEDLDILVAATCMAYNLTLVTSNISHFKRIPKLKIYRK